MKAIQSEILRENHEKVKRYPNLSTILMVENILKKNRDVPMKVSELKRMLPKQIMHPTLKIILEYLFVSGKIIYGPKGIQWIFSEPDHLKKMMKDSLEICTMEKK